MKAYKLTELDRLIAEQIKDQKSRHVSKDGREFTVDPTILDDLGRHYDKYHGWIPEDI